MAAVGTPRSVASLLSIMTAVLCVTLMARHRQGELADAHWLEAYERVRFRHACAWTLLQGADATLKTFMPVWSAGWCLPGRASSPGGNDSFRRCWRRGARLRDLRGDTPRLSPMGSSVGQRRRCSPVARFGRRPTYVQWLSRALTMVSCGRVRGLSAGPGSGWSVGNVCALGARRGSPGSPLSRLWS